MSNIQKYLGKALFWIIFSDIDHNINISKYNTLAGGSYMKLPKELNHSKNILLIFKTLMIENALNGF